MKTHCDEIISEIFQHISLKVKPLLCWGIDLKEEKGAKRDHIRAALIEEKRETFFILTQGLEQGTIFDLRYLQTVKVREAPFSP